ncbi:hypothetical protein ACFYWY_16650 [Streptomyces sp. NPDC002870]|uniref:hypothetical protein n=1 Tax=Streptomyces sp. NPDC002870 TaxID=3364666 RepID=UPI0036CC22D7
MRRMNPTETKKTTDTTDVTDAPDAAAAESAESTGAEVHTAEAEDIEDTDEAPRASSGLGAAAAGVVSVGLGVVALSGTWVGKIAAERQALVGQIKTSQGGDPAQQISAIYGDAWHSTAMFNGIFALLALIVGLAVFALPQKAGWVRAFALAGVALGVLGLIVSAGMYFDLFMSLPSAGS